MSDRTLRGKVAIVGIGETTYYKHSQAPESEFKMALQAILAACTDAGINAHEIDGFASYGDDRNDSVRLATALGLPRLRTSVMQWGGGGGGCCAAVANGAAAIATGQADCVVVFRSLAQGQFGRFGQSAASGSVTGERSYLVPYGVISPPQRFAMRVMRYMHEHGVRQEALRAIAMASYHHAQNNPRAVMYGKPLSEERYDASRWIVEPFHLFDCCMENDGAAALILMDAERAKELQQKPVYLLGAASGASERFASHAHNSPHYASADFTTVAKDLYRMARISPAMWVSCKATKTSRAALSWRSRNMASLHLKRPTSSSRLKTCRQRQGACHSIPAAAISLSAICMVSSWCLKPCARYAAFLPIRFGAMMWRWSLVDPWSRQRATCCWARKPYFEEHRQ